MNKAPALLRTSLSNYVATRGAAYQGKLKCTMNDLPQPCGDWKTHYDANQRKWNTGLLLSTLFLVGTFTGCKSAGFLWYPTAPECPAENVQY